MLNVKQMEDECDFYLLQTKLCLNCNHENIQFILFYYIKLFLPSIWLMLSRSQISNTRLEVWLRLDLDEDQITI